MSSCPVTPLVDLHFALRIRPADEARLREHLPSCADCRGRYERQLLLARLDPSAPSAQRRLGRALGIREPEESRLFSSLPRLVPGLALASAGLIALLLMSPGSSPEEEFQARGAPPAAAEAALEVFELSSSGPPRRVEGKVRSGAELAFTYTNAAGHPYLLLYAVDEHGHVYWYAPTWTDPSSRPTALAVSHSHVEQELPLATAHRFDGRRLSLRAVFTKEAVDVVEAERRIASGRPAAAGEEVTLELEVEQ